tara:strand:- start:297 stop:458 length:162 start_codon:yes stop_codon:yes gene_type:complete
MNKDEPLKFDKICLKCGSLVGPSNFYEDFTSYKCKTCGEKFAVINPKKFPHGV